MNAQTANSMSIVWTRVKDLRNSEREYAQFHLKVNQGRRDSSFGKAFASQVQGPELDPQNSYKHASHGTCL